MLIKILSAVIKHRGEYTVIVVDWFRCIIAKINSGIQMVLFLYTKSICG